MNIKLIAEKFTNNYDSDQSNNRSRSVNRENISNRNYEENYESNRGNKRYLIQKPRYEYAESDKLISYIPLTKIDSLETLKNDRDYKSTRRDINNKVSKHSEKKDQNSDLINYEVNKDENAYSSQYNQSSVYENDEEIFNKKKKIKENYSEFNQNSEYVSEKNNSYFVKNKYKEFKELNEESNRNNNQNEFKVLKEKYVKLKEEYKFEKDSANHWRNSYYNLLKNSFMFDETIRSLIEENRIHQEYIINLEKKNNKILSTSTETMNNFHNMLNIRLNSLYLNEMNNNLTNSVESINKLFSKNFSEIMNDYKKQLDILSEEKESLFRNLSLARHQNLQMTLKLEEIQNRIYYIEKLNVDNIFFNNQKA